MTQTFKKALSVLLAACLAVSCFTVGAFGANTFAGYDREGWNTDLKANYSFNTVSQSDEELVVDLVVNHPGTKLYGFDATLVYDSNKLSFTGVSLAEGFANGGVASKEQSVSLAGLQAGYEGEAITANDFSKFVGGAELNTSALATVRVEGVPESAQFVASENTTKVATLTFEVKGAGNTALTAFESIVYSDARGFYDLIATVSDDDTGFHTACAAVTPLDLTLTGAGSGVSYDITFAYKTAEGADTTTVVPTAEGATPVAPETPVWADGDYDKEVVGWSPELGEATKATTYTAVYDEGEFVGADYTGYDSIIGSCTTAVESDLYTMDSITALNSVMHANEPIPGCGRTYQATLDAMTSAIESAYAQLVKQTYTVTFNYIDADGVSQTNTQTVERHGSATAPEVTGYEQGGTTYTFTGWDPALNIEDVVGNTTYTAQYSAGAANFADYEVAKNNAQALIDSGKYADDSAMATLKSLLGQDISGYDATQQAEIDALTNQITQAASLLNKKTFDITFIVRGVPTQVTTVIDEMPIAPATQDYVGEDDYSYTFAGWDKEIVPATEAVTYTAQYNKGNFNEANYFYYNAAVGAATQAIDADIYTADSLATLTTVLQANTLADNLGASKQNEVDTATANINAAVESLQIQYYTITFAYKTAEGTDTTTVRENVQRKSTPEAPTSLPQYTDGVKTYTFTGWDATVVPAVASVTYTAQYSSSANPADFTKYTNAKAAAESAIATGNYKDDEAMATLTSLLAQDVSGYDKETQAELDALADSITSATAALNLKDADYTPWTDALAAVPANLTTGYKSASVAAVQTAMADAPATGLKITEQDQITAKVNALNSAVANLVAREDNSALQSAVTTLENYTFDEASKKPASVSAFNTAKAQALSGAQAVLNNVDATAEEIATALNAVNAVVGLLEDKADTTAFSQALAQAVGKNTDSYTPDSVVLYNAEVERLAGVLANLTGDESDSDIAGYVAEVEAAANLLVAQADKGSLKTLIDEAEALDPAKYIDFSEVTSALATAKAVYTNANATDTEVANAIQALNTALGGLVFAGADYTAWNTQRDRYTAIADKSLYTTASLKAVTDTLAKVKLNQDVNYQAELDALVAELKDAIDSLAFIVSWAGETSFDGTVYETFNSNLEYSVENLTNPLGNYEAGNEIKVTVTLNHPAFDVSAITNAVLYDGDLLTFKSAEANGGTVLFSETGAATFNPADFGEAAMTTPSILKVGVLYDSVKAAQPGVRDEVMVLYFTVKGTTDPSGSQNTVITSAPLASNVGSVGGNYAEITDSTNKAHFTHRTGAKFTVGIKGAAGVSVTGSVTALNSNTATTLTLSNADNTYTTTIDPKAGSGEFTETFGFEEVEAGTYTLVITKAGSLTYTITDITVGDVDLEIGEAKLIAGDVNGDGVINTNDVILIFSDVNYLAENMQATPFDVNGDGVVTVADVAFIYADSAYLKETSDCTFSFAD